MCEALEAGDGKLGRLVVVVVLVVVVLVFEGEGGGACTSGGFLKI